VSVSPITSQRLIVRSAHQCHLSAECKEVMGVTDGPTCGLHCSSTSQANLMARQVGSFSTGFTVGLGL